MEDKNPLIHDQDQNPLLSQKDLEELKQVSDNDQDGKIEQLKADFLSDLILGLGLTSRLERVHINGVRYYFIIHQETQVPIFFKGTSEVVSLTMPAVSKKDALLEWYMKHFDSIKLAREYVRTKSQYGTFMHSIFAIYWREGGITKQDLNAYLTDFMTRENISFDYFDFWSQDVMSDLMCFETFMIQHKVEPLAFEIPLFHPDGFATQIDLPCEMSIWEKGYHGEVYKTTSDKYGYKAGDQKMTTDEVRIRAIINFKSKRDGGFHADNELQLVLERMIWNHHFESHGLKIERIFNWGPKSWTRNGKSEVKVPGFHLTEKTHTKEADCLHQYIAIAKNKGLIRPQKSWVDFDQMVKGQPTEYKVHTLESFVTWAKTQAQKK